MKTARTSKANWSRFGNSPTVFGDFCNALIGIADINVDDIADFPGAEVDVEPLAFEFRLRS